VLRPGATRGADGIEGLLLSGGVDVEPARLGEEMPPEVAGLVKVEAARDQLEWELLDQATRLGMPVLGICRGVQVLNAYLGGALYLDLPAAGFSAVDHAQRQRMQEPVHEVRVLGGRLSRLMGDERAVNSSHHQAVREPAPGLVVTARSEDGVIEGLESPDGMLLGVQWHPETLIERSPAARAIFADLVARVRLAAERV
jgi:putative glutamine amidotransferase